MFKNSLKSDRGDGALVVGIVAIPLLVITMGIGIDLNRSVSVKREHSDTAQNVANKIVSNVGINGTLDKSSTQKTGTDHAGVWYSNFQSDEMRNFRVNQCAKGDVRGVQRDMPYIEVTYRDKRKQEGTEEIRNTTSKAVFQAGSLVSNNLPANGRTKIPNTTPEEYIEMRVAEVTVWDSSSNLFGGMFGLPQCSTTNNTVSAVVFGSDTDI